MGKMWKFHAGIEKKLPWDRTKNSPIDIFENVVEWKLGIALGKEL